MHVGTGWAGGDGARGAGQERTRGPREQWARGPRQASPHEPGDGTDDGACGGRVVALGKDVNGANLVGRELFFVPVDG